MRIVIALIFLVQAALASTVTIGTTSLPSGTAMESYSASVSASGGCTPYKWTTTGLPSGLTAKASTTTSLSISGTPQKGGSFSVTVSVKGCGGRSSSKTFALNIHHAVALSWSPETGMTFNVYRTTVSGGYYGLIASKLPSPSYLDASVSSGTTYYYVTTAVNQSGQESAHSAQVSAAVP